VSQADAVQRAAVGVQDEDGFHRITPDKEKPPGPGQDGRH